MEEDTQALVTYRLEQARDALKAGQLAYEAGLCRDSVNRHYYAMFYAVLALLGAKGETPGKHTQAIGLFDLEFARGYLQNASKR
ncbi:MAG: HEPN domain-containing protein [Candidatus Sumerlaeota bacterium]|nr:HEPN domain-containing protein [Candidatus Sumerlaeota bacterium]